MKDRDDYERAIQVVRAVVHRWDPYDLLGSGCPLDEFDSEIASVVTQIPRIRSNADAACALSRVFSSAFEPEKFSIEACSAPGTELYAALLADGLLAK
jgi:hypothetical protein